MLAHTRVYLALGNKDMHKSINGLSILVEDHLQMDPFSGYLFMFCNRRRNIVKMLYWDRNGFCPWHKRLEKRFFRWLASAKQKLEIDQRQLGSLLEGLAFHQIRAYSTLNYTTI
jgi:transposase